MSIDDYSFQATLDGVSLDNELHQGTWLADDFVVFHSGSNTGVGLRDPASGNIDVYKTLAKPHTLREPQLFPEYRALFFESIIVNTLVRFLTEEIAGPSYYFEGTDDDKVKQVEDFWFEEDMFSKLEEVVEQTVLLGTGVGSTGRNEDKLEKFRRLDASALTIDRDSATGEERYFHSGQEITGNEFILRFIRYPDTPWGLSFARAPIMSIQGLESIFRDIPPAIKQLAYVDRVLKLNLDEIGDKEQKKTILRKAKDAFSKYDSATTTVIVMSDKNEFGYAGTITGSGGAQTRIDPILPIIEPILLFVLLSFRVAPGEVLQGGANKAILANQRILAQKRIQTLKLKFAREVERKIIGPLLGETGQPSVRIRYEPDPIPPEEEAVILLEEYRAGVVSREEFRKRRGHRGELGDTMIWDTPASWRSQRSILINAQKELTDEEQDSIDDANEELDTVEALEGEENEQR